MSGGEWSGATSSSPSLATIVDHDAFSFVPPEHWGRDPEGSPRWEMRRAWDRFVAVAHHRNRPHITSVVDAAAMVAYWAARVAIDHQNP